MLVASDALVAGEMRVVRLESALGPCVQGLHEKREKVPHPGLQHVYVYLLCHSLSRETAEAVGRSRRLRLANSRSGHMPGASNAAPSLSPL